MFSKFKLAILLFCTLMLSFACSKDDDKQDEKDDLIIREYISANNLDATKTESGLYYVIESPGNNQHPTLNNEVKVDYTGYFTDGKVFDESVSTFSLRGVIAGWREGIPLFGKGGKGKLLIPSRLGYGSNPPPGIPKDAVLLFDIHLIDIK